MSVRYKTAAIKSLLMPIHPRFDQSGEISADLATYERYKTPRHRCSQNYQLLAGWPVLVTNHLRINAIVTSFTARVYRIAGTCPRRVFGKTPRTNTIYPIVYGWYQKVKGRADGVGTRFKDTTGSPRMFWFLTSRGAGIEVGSRRARPPLRPVNDN